MAPSDSVSPVVLVDEMPLDPLIKPLLFRTVVETSLHLPNTCELTFSDPDRTVVELGGFLIGSPLSVEVAGADDPLPIFNGFVEALELEYDISGKKTIIRAMDSTARLMKGRMTRTFQEMLASEMVEEILAERGIELNEIMPSEIFYTYMIQAAQSDWQFIQKLAFDNGFRAYVDGMGIFHFQPTTPAVEMPVPGTYAFNLATQLVLGKSLRRLHAVMRSAEQVDGVEVGGWSPLIGGPVYGVGVEVTEGVENLVQPEEVAALGLGGVFTNAWFPNDNEDEAEAKAEAMAIQLAEAYAELEGEAYGHPSLQAGTAISLAGAGIPFDGSYTLTAARHVFTPDEPYLTHINVSGWQDRTMLGLASGPEQSLNAVPGRIPGVVCARVINCRDPEDQGRVQLMFPWMDPDAISDWARVMQFGTNPGTGFLIVPEEGSEVLVAFDQGDPRRPYVIGGLYNFIDEPLPSPLLIDEATGLVNERRMMSRDMHQVSFYDGEEQNGILIQTGDEVQQLKLDALEQMITIMNVDGEITISGAVISIQAEGDLSLEALGELSITAANITIESEGAIEITTEGDLAITGGAVELTAEEMMAIDGPIVAING